MSGSMDLFAGADAEQVEMMKERVILLDRDDNVIGHASKKESHLMENINKGMLHRAFSVFMFTPDHKLILQQRSAAKITFPAYWANTCCSHPLYRPTEIDGEAGVKNAAVRKLEQELGVKAKDVPLDSFSYLTRVHYAAPSDGVWGEHEIDYILICAPGHEVPMEPNVNEVQNTRSFTQEELREWVATAEERGDLISPWFRIIEKTLLHKWWSALKEGTLADHVDPVTIHRAEGLHRMAAAADGVEYEGESKGESAPSSDAKKQGAYGKIKIHKESILTQLLHVSEVYGAIKFKAGLDKGAKVKPLPSGTPATHIECEEFLCKVSRSFAMVIKQLPDDLRKCVCVFYLALRALDTVEDDMEAFTDPAGHLTGRTNADKLAHLRNFYKYLSDRSWKMHGVGFADEAHLLERFQCIADTFLSLPKEQQNVISSITKRMGAGMAEFAGRDLRAGTEDERDYGLYCHYVAGLVGEGLSSLFSATGREDASLARQTKLANDMGKFLQKTNIIRDYLEDLVEGRAFWPKSIVHKYAPEKAGGLKSLADPANRPAALATVNHLVADALSHAPGALQYMNLLRDPAVFRFCAIPQVMAIATLAKLTDNHDVFTGVVKIRKGLALKLMRDASDHNAVFSLFLHTTRQIVAKIPDNALNAEARALATESARQVEVIALKRLPVAPLAFTSPIPFAIAVLLLAVTLRFLSKRSHMWDGMLPRITDSIDVAGIAVLMACVIYLLGFTGVPLVQSLVAPGASGTSKSRSLPGEAPHDETTTAGFSTSTATSAHRTTSPPERRALGQAMAQ